MASSLRLGIGIGMKGLVSATRRLIRLFCVRVGLAHYSSHPISSRKPSSPFGLPRTSEPSEESLDVYIPSFPGSPRSLCVNLDQTDIASKVLQEDADILLAAEINNDHTIARLLKQNVNIQATDHLGRNALHFAVQNRNIPAIEMLLKAGIDATIKDNVGMTPLLLCLMRSPSLKIVQLLFDYGAKILPRSSPMDTGIFLQFVMMCTPTKEDAKILRLLVEKGAVVDDPGAPGQRQALHFAAMSNNCNLIKILLDLGANLNATNHRNETPREVAKIFHCKEAAALLASIENMSSYNIDSSLSSDDISDEDEEEATTILKRKSKDDQLTSRSRVKFS